ncbi:hypothetical protein [Sporichthya sp.]|uniref:hypothetical protein n=1 Tax=Sporichthya sp. TaxID=65475 RepID=UPI00185E132D|nr:hypothetical protein [Sporichthya sp.]MBA3741633.1 hypothetical protein [Sporichthya sp.]
MGFLKYIRAQWDRSAAVLAAVIGLVSLLLGWIGTSGTEHLAKQMPYIVSGGMAGIFFLGVGAVLWISADLRDEWRELRSLGAQLREEKLELRLAVDGVQAATYDRPVPSHAGAGS